MKPHPFHRLHELRIENDEHKEIMDEHRPRFDRLRDRENNGTAPKAITAFNLFQTPEALASEMVELLDPSPLHTILDPSVGLGRLIKPLLDKMVPDVLTVCDESKECLAHIFETFEDAEIVQGDFLSKNLGPYDRIIMNPPFKMRRDIKHILHAVTHLAPGGRLVGLCMDGHQREEKLKHLCTTWKHIPAGAFKSEGTNVPTIMFSIDN